MPSRFRTALIVGANCVLAGCGLFDSGTLWTGGHYKLEWIDDPQNVSLVYDLGNDTAEGVVEPTVFSVGWNGRYLVVKQHPHGDKNITHFYIVDDTIQALPLHPERALIGPLTADQFREKQRTMQLPEFTKSLASLQ